MNPWQALYIKELKDNRTVFFFLIVGSLVAGMYAYFNPLRNGQPSPYLGLILLPLTSLFILPFALIHTFSQEFKAQTHYQLLSLPVSRATVVICKFLAVFSVGVAIYLLGTGATHLLYLKLMDLSPPNMHLPGIQGPDLWLLIGNWYFMILLLLMGIATAMSGLKLLVRRFQGLIMTAFFAGSLYLYGRLLKAITDVVGKKNIGGNPIEIVIGNGEIEHIPSLLPVGYFTILFGLLFLGIGILLYERYAEA